MGLDTSNQDGSTSDYNSVTVREIYDGYPDNRSSAPGEGTSGYYFTSYGNDGMEHMGAYSRTSGSSTYTRYWNDSYTEHTSTRSAGYTPNDVTEQSFVPLPRYDYYDIYYR